jgi:hypothetical protein
VAASVIVRVVVEPDSLSAWIGLAGVGIGVVLSAGVQIVRDAIQGRKNRTRELTEAVARCAGDTPCVLGAGCFLSGRPGRRSPQIVPVTLAPPSAVAAC